MLYLTAPTRNPHISAVWWGWQWLGVNSEHGAVDQVSLRAAWGFIDCRNTGQMEGKLLARQLQPCILLLLTQLEKPPAYLCSTCGVQERFCFSGVLQWQQGFCVLPEGSSSKLLQTLDFSISWQLCSKDTLYFSILRCWKSFSRILWILLFLRHFKPRLFKEIFLRFFFHCIWRLFSFRRSFVPMFPSPFTLCFQMTFIRVGNRFDFCNPSCVTKAYTTCLENKTHFYVCLFSTGCYFWLFLFW